MTTTPATLLERLPAKSAAHGNVGWVAVPLPPGAQRMAADLADEPAGPARLLAACLALVESRLTGSTAGIARTWTPIGGLASRVLDCSDEVDLRDWLTAAASIGESTPDGELDWVVVADGANDFDLSALARSWWRFRADARALEIGFAPPLASDTVELLADCVCEWLAQAAEHLREPAKVVRLGALDLLSKQGREWQLQARAGQSSPGRHGNVVAQFAQACAAHAKSEAVRGADLSWTYAELDRRSSALAAGLQASGVAHGEVVAIAVERSAEAIVALLAVLKAGAAYLPLDRRMPEERLRFLLNDARARVAVVARGNVSIALPEDILVVPVDAETTASPQPVAIRGDDLAYVLYTSGSTGTPKGVQVRHDAILNLVRQPGYAQLGSESRLLHAAPLGFDASTFEIWGALLHGGCIVVHDEDVPTGRGLARTISGHGVTTAWLTAALFNAVVDEDPGHLSGLRELFTGGEALSVAHVRRMRQAVPDVALRNGYGPTECTTFTTIHPIDDVPEEATSIPIGSPIPGVNLYVLSPQRKLLPTGAIGELYIGGAGLARGYLNQPELSAERFVQDPFVPGERLYRSGDLVRWTADGALDYISRIDTQVKIRGFRIEPGEIEAALLTHSQVQSVAVVPLDVPGGGHQLCAYVVAKEQAQVQLAQLREHLAERLPDYMVPARWVQLDALPVTANGKLDRRALPRPGRARPALANDYQLPANDIESKICACFAEVLDLDSIGRNDHFFEAGGTSLLATRLAVKLQAALGREVPVTLVFGHPTPAGLAAALDAATARAGVSDASPARLQARDSHEPIAIVAMAGRFPGADSVETFWDNLCAGRESITRFDPGSLDPSIPASERSDPAYVAARGVIDGVEQFDAAFFGISPREAELMDPQQRIFLELCWQCLERGGHVPDAAGARVGIFAGMYNATYFQRHVSRRPDLVEKLGAFQVMLDNEKDYIATRVAHRLDLTGPAISVHTACSTSLVAICQAMDSLRAGRCEMALAGGVAVTCPPNSGYLYQEGAMLSPDASTRTFDAAAKGTVFSDGAAVVLLKRLSDAIADGNPIFAVVRGGAVNNDGGRKASFTAPSAQGQAAVIEAALADAAVEPRSIGYVEAHGTATPLGDPIEIEGLTRAFSTPGDVGYCRIGSVKSNIGHAVIAAGAAGVIKTALSLHHERIPASLHFQAANPALALDATPFVVNAEMSAWPRAEAPRRAGVSSFGVGGTNAHVILEEAPLRAASDLAEGAQLLQLSARTPVALAAARTQLADYLESAEGASVNFADVAWTLAVGRKAFPSRSAVVAIDAAHAARQLRENPAKAGPRASGVVFLFPGQGCPYPGMGRVLYAQHRVLADAVDQCAQLLHAELGYDLRERLFSDDADTLLPTAVMQPAIFTIEYALARLWMSLGVNPVAMAGHSVGEFVAATIAGVFALPDALRLVAIRGRLMQAQPAGGMLAVRAPYEQIQQRLPVALSMAAENAPGSCVVAGPSEVLATFEAQLAGEGIACRLLRTSHAFHSAMMDPVVAPFHDEVASVSRAEPRIPIISTVSGKLLEPAEARDPGYWSAHLREPVRFASALGTVLQMQPSSAPGPVLLEVGPRATLSGLARQHPTTRTRAGGVVSSLSDASDSEQAALLAAVGQVWSAGIDVAGAGLDTRTKRHRLCLPAYPFERQRHWVDAVPLQSATEAVGSSHATLSSTIPESALSPGMIETARVEASPVAPAAPFPRLVDPVMPQIQSEPVTTASTAGSNRHASLSSELRALFDDVTGFDIAPEDASASFLELGLDSLMLTQVALQLQRRWPVQIGFRQLMGECGSLDALATQIDAELPLEPAAPVAAMPPPAAAQPPGASAGMVYAAPIAAPDGTLQLLAQQMQLMSQMMSQQAALLAGGAMQAAAPPATVLPSAVIAGPAPAASGTAAPAVAAPAQPTVPTPAPDEETALAHTTYDVRKAFGAIARIHSSGTTELSARQRERLDAFMARYIARTIKSREYTETHRTHMADPRVVNGFRPLTKEITYQIVIERSKGAHLTDLDGNDYVDALNGFGMSLFGWQPDFVLDAVKRQLELGYEIGPQHPLAGEVSRLACEVTGHDRAALCNTGSEAVLGALRIARTVTGRETVVVFNGAYHGIIDEMIVRGTKKLRAVPAAPGILRNTAEHVLVLDYGTPESMQIIRERAGEIAAVLVEPVQSRRPDFRPIEFLRELREVTEQAGALLVFDEVVTGFRSHPAGAQGLFGIRADLATYGKVVGGGYPIGVIAGKRAYMDALDGGHWQFGDDSVPTVGVTYFAGTFVRHPLALAAAKAVLEHIQAEGPELQERLNARVSAMAEELNAFCANAGAPIEVRHFASVWKTFFLEDHPLQDLLFGMMRSRGVHILDNFPCFFTTAHSEADFQRIIDAFKASVTELQEAEFLPRLRVTPQTVMEAARPVAEGARLGRDPQGRPAWYVPDPETPGEYRKVG